VSCSPPIMYENVSVSEAPGVPAFARNCIEIFAATASLTAATTGLISVCDFVDQIRKLPPLEYGANAHFAQQRFNAHVSYGS
jgi:hypothetical protein